MKILVVDDEALARERMATLLQDLGPDYRLAGEAAGGAQALAICAAQPIDLVLMDISMPGMDGLSAARKLAELETPPAVIFTTAHADHALDAFDANAVDYLLKPVRRSRLLAALQRAVRPTRAQLDRLAGAENGAADYINASYRGGLQRIALANIICLRADSKYVEVCHTEGTSLVEQSLKSLEHRFAAQFLRIHRNALINPGYLTGLEKTAGGGFEALLGEPTQRLEVSRRHLPRVRRLLKGE